VFGFGNKLVSFNSKSKSIQVKQIFDDEKFARRAVQLEDALVSGSFEQFCSQRAADAANATDAQTWQVLSILFASKESRKDRLLTFLGYDKATIDQ
jgi:hypothetical protein